MYTFLYVLKKKKLLKENAWKGLGQWKKYIHTQKDI